MRCKVEEISEIDEIKIEINEYKEEPEQLNLQANELLGDTRVLREQIEKAIKESQIKKANTPEVQLTRLEYDIYRLPDKIEKLTIETIDKFVIEKIQKEIERIKNSVQSYVNEYKNLSLKLKAEKLTVDAGVKVASPLARDAAALWQLASSKFTRGLDYIEKNGKIVEKVSDLSNKELKNSVRTKLEKQIQTTEARGVLFSKNSSLSRMVSSSKEFKQVIKNNETKLRNSETIPKVSIFLNSSLNNILSIHGCDILNLRIENGIVYATALDTVDYNPNEWWVWLPNNLQENGAIENYYVLIEIEVPISENFNFTKAKTSLGQALGFCFVLFLWVLTTFVVLLIKISIFPLI